MKKIYLGLAFAVFTASVFFACKKEEVVAAATTTGGTTSTTGGTTSGTAANNQLIFDGETVDFTLAMGVPSSGNTYTITGSNLSGASLVIFLPGTVAPTADASYTIVPKPGGLLLSAGEASFNIVNTPKHPMEVWMPFTGGTLELKMVNGKIQVKFVNVSAVKAGTITPSMNASGQLTTTL